MYAAWHGRLEIARSLVSRGADVNAEDPMGWTPLIFAAFFGQTDVARFLIEKGANIDAVDSRTDKDAMAFAKEKGHDDIVKLLEEARQQKARTVAPASESVQPRIRNVSEKQESSGVSTVLKSDVDAPQYKGAENSDDFALVIGIEKYSNLPDAEFAERDAAAVREHLIALGYPEANIIALSGSKATMSAFAKNIESWLPLNVNKKSTVFVYYSGHGAPDVKTGQAYLVPWDGDPEFLEGSAYPVKRLYEKLGTLKAKRVIVALDSCFSGAGGRSVLAKGTRPLVTKMDMGAIEPGKIVALSASDSDQISGTVDDQGHGAFTYYLLKGLNGAAADDSKHVTLRSLYDYLKPKVQAAAHRHNREQTPQLLPVGEPAALILR